MTRELDRGSHRLKTLGCFASIHFTAYQEGTVATPCCVLLNASHAGGHIAHARLRSSKSANAGRWDDAEAESKRGKHRLAERAHVQHARGEPLASGVVVELLHRRDRTSAIPEVAIVIVFDDPTPRLASPSRGALRDGSPKAPRATLMCSAIYPRRPIAGRFTGADETIRRAAQPSDRRGRPAAPDAGMPAASPRRGRQRRRHTSAGRQR